MPDANESPTHLATFQGGMRRLWVELEQMPIAFGLTSTRNDYVLCEHGP